MNKKLFKNTLLVIMASFLVSSCSGKPNNNEINEIIRDIVLENSKISLNVGDTYQLCPTLTTGEDASYSYRTLNEEIISVSASGLVTALKEGKGRIEITYQSLRTLCEITVLKNQNSSLFTFILDDTNISLLMGNSYHLSYKAYYGGSEVVPTFEYFDYDPTVIAISDMTITGLKKGETSLDVVATYKEESFKETINVVVDENKPVLSIDKQFNQIVIGDEAMPLTFSLSKGNQVIKVYNLNEVGLKISDTSLAIVTPSGLVGLKRGYFKLTISVNYNNSIYTVEKEIRVREKYYITDRKTGNRYEVLDGDRIIENPINSNPDLVFKCFIKDNSIFDEPINSDMTLDIVWSSKTYNYKDNNLNSYLLFLESSAYYNFRDMVISKDCSFISVSSIGAYNANYLMYKSEIEYYDSSYTGCSHEINEDKVCNICNAQLDDNGWEINFPHSTSYFEVGLPQIKYSDFIDMKVVYQIKGTNSNMSEGVYFGFSKDDLYEVRTGSTYYLVQEVISDSLIKTHLLDSDFNVLYTSSSSNQDVINGQDNYVMLEKTIYDFNRGFEISEPLFVG